MRNVLYMLPVPKMKTISLLTPRSAASVSTADILASLCINLGGLTFSYSTSITTVVEALRVGDPASRAPIVRVYRDVRSLSSGRLRMICPLDSSMRNLWSPLPSLM